jgi:hypothetical protein
LIIARISAVAGDWGLSDAPGRQPLTAARNARWGQCAVGTFYFFTNQKHLPFIIWLNSANTPQHVNEPSSSRKQLPGSSQQAAKSGKRATSRSSIACEVMTLQTASLNALFAVSVDIDHFADHALAARLAAAFDKHSAVLFEFARFNQSEVRFAAVVAPGVFDEPPLFQFRTIRELARGSTHTSNLPMLTGRKIATAFLSPNLAAPGRVSATCRPYSPWKPRPKFRQKKSAVGNNCTRSRILGNGGR